MPISEAAAVLSAGGEALTLRRYAPGSFDVGTQKLTPGAPGDTSFTGVVTLANVALDGPTTVQGELEVWASKLQLVSGLKVGDLIIRNQTSQVLTVLEVTFFDWCGAYMAKAEVAS